MTTSRIVVWNLPAEARNVSTSDGLSNDQNLWMALGEVT